MKTVLVAASVNLACVAFCTPAFAADPIAITSVAPKDSLAVISIPSWPAMRAAFDKTSFSRAWREPSVQRYIEDLVEQAKTDDANLSKVLGRWREFAKEMDEPTGAVGLAVFIAEVRAKEADVPPRKLPNVLLLSDFGANAEKAETEMVKLLREGVADGEFTLEESSEDGVVIYSMTMKNAAEEEVAADDEEDDEFDFDEPDGPEWDHLDTMHMARVGQVIYVGSHRESFVRSLGDAKDGRSTGLADQPLYKDAIGQIGGDNHLFATFMLTDQLRSEIRTMLSSGDMMLPLPLPIDFIKLIEASGLSEFKAASLGVRFNTERADVEQSIGLLASGKKGLITLLESDSSAFNPPAFAPADAVSVGRLTVRFDRLMGVLRELTAILPAEMKGEAEGGLQTFEASFGPAIRSLGPSVFVINTVAKPYSTSSESQVIAMACGDEMAVNNAVAGLAPQMGAEARDFQGFQVYDGGFTPTAIGIGAGFVFVGPTESVENALRAASQQDAAAKFADEPRFRQAVAQLKAEGNAYSFIRGKESLEYAYWQLKNADKIALDQMREMGFEISEEDEKDFVDEDMAKWTKNLPPVEDVSKHFGDSIMVVKPSPDGFRFTSLTLRPAAAK